ncbi:hypothetical protein QAD02_011968 [Eretmocerus hayati]|uniref:Uncharacterized protein n=1 Tax=Eretmocerus hayati TaxID=131215 RepID=A0ACC2P152_9HYME|nr:hypothetical protein QAD02_011968 [Eretmocerus hayati]
MAAGPKISPTEDVRPEQCTKQGGIDIEDQVLGMVVWGKIQGYSLWPCVIVGHQHLNCKEPDLAHQWVMWYGDYKISQVDYRKIFQFPARLEEIKPKIRNMKDTLFSKAVLQAFKDYYRPSRDVAVTWTLEGVVHSIIPTNMELGSDHLNICVTKHVYHRVIEEQLRMQFNYKAVPKQRSVQVLNSKDMQLALRVLVSPMGICISCSGMKDLKQHPFFTVSLCSECLDAFRANVFGCRNDGKCLFCALCGGAENVIACERINCPRVFCMPCIKNIICLESGEHICTRESWHCFFCDTEQMLDSVLGVQKDWRSEFMAIHQNTCNVDTRPDLGCKGGSKKIRVLSLFDGIATGLVVLKNLGFDIEIYYASEIDPDAIRVSSSNHGDQIKQLGDVREITEEVIKKVCPIDLLIGGSPCNELSSANPKSRGLDDPGGTGVLFYNYHRIRGLVTKRNEEHHSFWYLGREPKFIESADFSAQRRPRLYWGNVPWGPYEKIDVTLQDMLEENCHRIALVGKIATVTTRANSLGQSKNKLKPVYMDGEPDQLWITEVKKIFGLPKHYTDVDLPKTRWL